MAESILQLQISRRDLDPHVPVLYHVAYMASRKDSGSRQLYVANFMRRSTDLVLGNGLRHSHAYAASWQITIHLQSSTWTRMTIAIYQSLDPELKDFTCTDVTSVSIFRC